MTPATSHLQARSDHFGALAKLYGQLSRDMALCEIERSVYDDVADLLNQIEDRFHRGVIELDEQGSLPLTLRGVRVIPILVAP